MKNRLKNMLLRHLLQDGFGMRGEVKWIKSKGGIVVAESPWMANKIVANDARGIYILLDLLTGDQTYSGEITHADIGDDGTAATDADTALGNGLERASIGAVSRSALTATFRFFYADALTADDTYEEFGMFVDGTSALGTGRLFNHLIFTTDLVKSSGEDHTVVCRITGSV